MLPSVEPLLKFKLRDVLSMTEIYTLFMLILYSVLAIIFHREIENPGDLVMLYSVVAIGLITLATAAERLNEGKLFRILKNIYIVPVVFFIYNQSQVYIRIINPQLYDSFLAQIDRAIFGVNPTWVLGRISNPALTEFLQLCYMLYFLMPLAHGIELYLEHKEKEYYRFERSMVFTFYLSYLVYFIFPAVGPRFYLHNYATINTDLPGLWLTNFFRYVVDLGGSIVPGSPDPASIVNRDCMPSGHTMLTLVNIYFAHKYQSRLRWFFYFFGTGLIIATVYLRYHYVIDLMAGFCLVFAAFWLEKKLRRFFKNRNFNNA